VRSKTTKHHRVDGSQTGTGQHGECRFGNHGHVDQDAVALGDAQVFQNGGHALHFGVQLAKAVGVLLVGFGGNEDQGRLIGAVFQMAVNCVVANIGFAADEPLGKRRVAVVTDLLGLRFPIHQLGLFGPKRIAVLNGTAVKICVRNHLSLLKTNLY